MAHLNRRRFVFSASAALSTTALGSSVLLPGCDMPTGVDGGDPLGDGGQDADAGPGPELVGPGPEPDALWEAPGTESQTLFPLGLQSGDARPRTILFSVQTSEASVDLVIARATEDGWAEFVRESAIPTSDGFVQIEITGLTPDFTYAATVYAAGNEVDRSRVARFRTALDIGQSRTVVFGSTSCLGGNEPWGSISAVAARKPDFMCLLGDTIYADDFPDDGINALWETALGVQGLRDILSATSIVATWDDHEVDNNWDLAVVGARFGIARASFRRYLPQQAGPNDEIYRLLSWGSVLDLFVLDCRGERENGDYISQAQMDWLKEALSSSTARFKIVMNSVPIIDFSDLPFGAGTIEADDRWQGFPAQRSELLDHISDNALPGVLFITGDFHLGGWASIDLPGGPAEGLFEVLTGPAGSPINPGAQLMQENERYPAVIGDHSSCVFTCDPDAGTILVEFLDDNAEVFRTNTFTL